MSFESHRPPGLIAKGDKYLPRLAQELERIIIKTQSTLAFNTLCLSGSNLEELTSVLVEFAEDIHNDIGERDVDFDGRLGASEQGVGTSQKIPGQCLVVHQEQND